MTTTVHLPERLLERVDARAKALGVSRNRVIVDALERTLGSKHAWPPELVRMLEAPLDRTTVDVLEGTLSHMRARRRSRRRPPKV